MRAPLSYVPAMPIAIGLIAGIAIFYCGSPILAVGSAVAATALTLARRMMPAAVILAAAAVGWCVASVRQPAAPPSGITHAEWRGLVTSVADAPVTTIYEVRVDSAACHAVPPFTCRLAVLPGAPEYAPGQHIAFAADILPSQRHTTGGEAFAAPDSIRATGISDTWQRRAWQWRRQLESLLADAPLDGRTAAFLDATLFADRSLLDADVRDNYRLAGLSHILALSGFHVGIIVMLISWALMPLRLWSRVGRYRHCVSIVFVWLYAMLAGLQPSVTRAAVMVSVYLAARMMQRGSSPYNSLAVAAIIILAATPSALLTPGFQLSFAAVLGILLFATPLNPFGRQRPVLRAAAQAVTVPVSAMAGTWVITAWHFGTFPLLFIISNLLVAVLFPPLIGGGAIMVLAQAAGLRLTHVGHALDALYHCADTVTARIASLPCATVDIGGLTPTLAIIAAVATAGLALLIRRRRR